MEEVIIDGKKYISAKQAAEITKYSQDYIGQLVRARTLPERLVGRTRFVEEEALFKYSSAAKFHNQNFSEPKEPALSFEEPKIKIIEELAQFEESKISEHVFNEPTGYPHGWQSRSPFDSAIEINVINENTREVTPDEKISQIKNLSRPWRSKLPHTTAFVSILLIVSGFFILFSSNESANKIAYVSETTNTLQVEQINNKTAALAKAGIIGDISFNIKKAIDSLTFRTYKNISASGNKLVSFVSNLFGGTGQSFFALFNKGENTNITSETVTTDSSEQKSAPVKITQSSRVETKEQLTKNASTGNPDQGVGGGGHHRKGG